MAKKDFSSVNTDRMYSTIEEATAEPQEKPKRNQRRTQRTQETQEKPKEQKARKTYTEEEQKAFKNELKTAGRKGVKLPRINLAFTEENYDYVKTLSAVRGETLTAFVNHILKLSLEEHRDIYEKALEFRNSL